jgi:hypothetical protein
VYLKTFTLIIIMILAGLFAAGCGGEPEPDITEIVPVNQDVIEIMKILPTDVAFLNGYDLKQMKEDAYPHDLYNHVMESIIQNKEGFESLTGISLTYVDTLVGAVTTDGRTFWTYFKGEFDFDHIRHTLDEWYFYQEDYMGIEAWHSPGNNVAFIKDIIVFSNQDYALEEAIELSHDSSSSMYYAEDFNYIISILPPGLGFSFIKNEYVDDQISGLTVYNSDDKILIRGRYNFPIESDAESYILKIEHNLESLFPNCDIECIQHQQSIEIKGEMDITDLVDSDFWTHGFSE